jgi:hypothetical protein
MRRKAILAVVCGFLVAQPYRQGSLEADRPQAVYANDPRDSWNRIFYSLFTQKITLRLTQDFQEGSPFHTVRAMGFPDLSVSDRTFERIESGDRGIDPLYPSFLNSLGTVRLFAEPRYSEFEKALRAALDDRNVRTPIERALMQSDLWAAYDMVYRNQRSLDATRSTVILQMLARMIRKLALTPAEIAALPDNYAAGADRLHLPDLFGERSSWIEIDFGHGRLHDVSANYRRSTRIFLKPEPKVTDRRALLEALRFDHSARQPLEAVALVTQYLVIDNTGNPAPSRITTEVQVREFSRLSDGLFSRTQIAEFELSRRAMLTDKASGGLVRFDENAPAYLSSSGNDYEFASAIDSSSGPKRDISIMGSLRTRCAGCHGKDVDNIFTFSRHDPEAGVITILDKRTTEHARYVVEQKTKLDSWKSLQERWRQN